MLLAATYFSNDIDQRLIVVEDLDESYVIINGTQFTSQELDLVVEWCRDKSAIFYNAGIVRFTDRATLLQFMLQWG